MPLLPEADGSFIQDKDEIGSNMKSKGQCRGNRRDGGGHVRYLRLAVRQCEFPLRSQCGPVAEPYNDGHATCAKKRRKRRCIRVTRECCSAGRRWTTVELQ